MAADSQDSDAEYGLYTGCDKIFRKKVPNGRRKHDVLIGTAGESYAGMLFVDWFPGISAMTSGGNLLGLPHALSQFDPEHNDFVCIILEPGGVWTVDAHLRPIKLKGRFFAVGSGSKLALAAMEMGASASRAVEVACKYDLYSRPPIVTERL